MTIVSQVRGLIDVTNMGDLNRVKNQKATNMPPRKRKSEQKPDDAQVPPSLRQSSAPHIDAWDCKNAHNELYCVEYQRSIYQELKNQENKWTVPANYMDNLTKVDSIMRTTLIDWLVEVHLKFKLLPETLFLTVNIMDRFLSMVEVEKNRLQLVGITSMLIASKYEEIYPPEIEDFCNITDSAYNRDQVLDMELNILNELEFNLTVPTSIMFLNRYLAVDGSTKDDLRFKIAHFLLEMMLTEYCSLKWTPSVLAASSLYLTNRLHEVSCSRESPSWSPHMEDYTQYPEKVLRDCTKEMLSLLCTQAHGNKSIFRKYRKVHNGEVFKSAPIQKVLQTRR